MKVLILGQGAREHALACACVRDTKVQSVWVAPGNAGTAVEDGVRNLELAYEADAVAAFARSEGVELVLIGPEQPIVAGLGDALRRAGVRCLAPSAAAARLEGSKAFAKRFMDEHGIPTAAYGVFHSGEDALAWIAERNIPVAIKADGLAGGKGVVLAQTYADAEQAVQLLKPGGALADAGKTLVVEELLLGRELSFIALADGERVLPLATSEDHKARDDGDKGPNTGGMGAVSPSPLADAALQRHIMEAIVQPTVAGMAAAGTPYCGFLYAGLMISPSGEVRVLEYNCRLGDPEAQVILMRYGDGFARLCADAADGNLSPDGGDNWSAQAAVTVVMASGGYPGSCQQGYAIEGLLSVPEKVKVFHGGTQMDARGQTVTAGGRVLSVTALGDDLNRARALAYQGVAALKWPDAFWRTDIGTRGE